MKYITLVILLFCITRGLSQDYHSAIGLRGGYSSGISYKRCLNDEIAYEGIFTIKNLGIQVTGLKEFHQPLLWKQSDKLYFVYGYGGHLGFFNRYYYHRFMSPFNRPIRSNISYFVTGLDALLGIEYRFIRFPFLAGVEYKPFFHLFGPNYFNMYLADVAITFKYILN